MGAPGTATRPVGLRPTLSALRGAQKTPRGVSAYSVSVNRPVGRYLAAVASVLGLSPDAVTVLSAVSSAAALALLLVQPARLWSAAAAAVLLAAGFALDSADGQLARLRGSGSPAGEWLDHLVDCGIKLALHGTVLVAWYRDGLRGAVLLVPLTFQSLTVLLFFGGTLAGLLLARTPATGVPATGAGVSRLLLLPVDHGVLCWSFLLWSWQPVFRGWYSALLVAQGLFLGLLSVHWWRQLRRAGPG